MSPNDGTPFKLRATLVDGIPARTGIDPFGTYSERIRILFDHEHDELGREFQTKRFMIRNEEPGNMSLGWPWPILYHRSLR